MPFRSEAELTLIIVMLRCVVEGQAELMMTEAAEACRLQDQQRAGSWSFTGQSSARTLAVADGRRACTDRLYRAATGFGSGRCLPAGTRPVAGGEAAGPTRPGHRRSRLRPRPPCGRH